MYDIVRVNDDAFTDADWQETWQLFQLFKTRYRAPCRSLDWQDMKQRMLSLIEAEPHFEATVLSEGGKQIGYVDVRLQHPGQDDQNMGLNFNVLHEHLTRDLSVFLARYAVDRMEQHHADAIFFWSWYDHITTVVEEWGARTFSRTDEYALKFDRVDSSELQQWRTKAATANPDIKVEFCRSVPDRLWDRHIRLLEEAMEDMPEEEASGISNRVDPEEIRRHDQWRKDNGIAVHYCFLLNQQSEPVGLTDVDVNLKLRDQVGQGITTVRRDYRGRGLARWLKAEMLAHLLGLHADCGKLITWMRTINEPIQKINAQLGYSLERQGRECMIKRHDLEMFASSSR